MTPPPQADRASTPSQTDRASTEADPGADRPEAPTPAGPSDVGPTEVAPGIHLIDTRMGGEARVTASYLVAGRAPALVETGPAAVLDTLVEGLEALGVGPEDLAHVVTTHIHLDHAGGVGAIARRFPNATVWVHERGARHLVDPGRLVASATRAFGEEHMARVFGETEPVDADRLAVLGERAEVDLGDRRLELLYAPGHAVHHLFVADSETGAVWTGDGMGIYLPDVGVLRPATPPPDFDLEQAIASIRLVAERRPPLLLFSHFGVARDVERIVHLAEERFRRWAAIVERATGSTEDLDEVVATLREQTADEVPASAGPAMARYDLLLDYRVNAAGLMRYYAKLREARTGPSGEPEGSSPA